MKTMNFIAKTLSLGFIDFYNLINKKIHLTLH